VIIGETVLGRGDEAWNYYRKICPAYLQDKQELHKVEPYVYSQMTAGKDAARPGEAKNSWLTGTAAWNWYAITEFILGIKPTLNGLMIDPCVPKDWKHYEVTRKYRGATYKISIFNANSANKGVKSVTFNGQTLNGNVLPIAEPGTENLVEVTL
jgi:cellobiose phosphorylase